MPARRSRRGSPSPGLADLRLLAGEFRLAAERGADDARAWLVSERGRRYRAYLAAALALAAPVVLRGPFLRTPAGRLIRLAGGAALVTRAIELLRDWEPATTAPVRVSSPPPAAGPAPMPPSPASRASRWRRGSRS